MLAVLALVFLNTYAWYPTLSFWFLSAWEPAWLIGTCGYDFNFLCLIKSHGVLLLFNYTLFGWNPSGWYLTAIILHIIVVLLIYKFIYLITKNKSLSFVCSLLFGVNVAHNDVINWGSFEGLYALLMVIFLLGIFCYLKFRNSTTNKRFIWYILTIVFFLFGLFTREVALVFPFFILITELLYNKFKLNKKYILTLFKLLSPLAIISIGYLFFRNWYGGAANDFIDGMVQLRINLLSRGQYGEYLWGGLLSFTRYSASHLVPYPFMNEAREIFTRRFDATFINYYFFPAIGTLYLLIKLLILWLFRKNKKIFHLLLFSFLWFIVPTVFFSFAFTITDYELQRRFEWSYTRWRYFAFFGTVIFWSSIAWSIFEKLSKKRNKTFVKYILIGAIVFVLTLNLLLLRNIQKEMYETTFKPGKEFYTTLKKEFPILPKNYIFYYFPYAPNLNDFLLEFYFLRKVYYSNLIEDRNDWVEGHLGMILERLAQKEINLNQVFFLDRTIEKGLINKTDLARKIIKDQKEYVYTVEKTFLPEDLNVLDRNSKHQLTIHLNPKLHVELPYVIEVSATAIPGSFPNLRTNLSEDIETLLRRYSTGRTQYHKNSKISVCKTASLGARSADAMHVLPKNMSDENIGPRSLWMADCRPAWVIIDLGSTQSIGAVAFRGIPKGPHLPGDYTISISQDGQEWKEILSVKKNNLYERIDKFPSIEQARFVKFTSLQTTQGAMLMLDELEVIGEDSVEVAGIYKNNYEKLLKDSHSAGSYFIRLSWDTIPNNFQETERLFNNSIFMPYNIDGIRTSYTFEPNEGEYFSATGQFLSRYITDLHLDFSGLPSSITIHEVRILPKYKIEN